MSASPDSVWRAPVGGQGPVAVIGAGLAGLTLAAGLHAAGRAVQVFDKSRGPGGRCATRRTAAGRFDHGAPLIQAHDPAFRAALGHWAEQGWLAPVDEALGGPGWVGVPSMNAWLQQLTQGLVIHTERPIAALHRSRLGWHLKGLDGEVIGEAFEAVLLALPAEQAAALLATATAVDEPMLPMATVLAALSSEACWTVMAAWPAELPLSLSHWRSGADECTLAPASPLGSAWRQDPRPGRTAEPGVSSRWVLHATAEWSAQNLDARPEAVVQRLVEALAVVAGARLSRPSFATAHRWRFAQPAQPLPEPFAWDARWQVGSCGDAWQGTHLHAGRPAQGLERAWLSAQALVQTLTSPAASPLPPPPPTAS
jgi:renalase